MRRAFRTSVISLAAAILVAGCTVKKTSAPPLTGPSELGTSLSMQANPDVLTRDGASQSVITIQARDGSGQPVRIPSVRLDITIGGVIVDFGWLSAKNVPMTSDGRATVTYTAPAAPLVSDEPSQIVSILVTPVGTDYSNSMSRSVDIRLVPPGVIIPPNDLKAGFTFAPDNPNTLDTVLFTSPPCQKSGDTGCTSGVISSYAWDFGDGSSGSGSTVSHVYRQVGNFVTKLTVSDSVGRSASASQIVTVGAGEAPTADFVFSPANPGLNQQIFFSASASKAATGRKLVSYDWDFGSGRTSTGITVSKSYSVAGAYNVTLTVTDDAGQTGVKSQQVTVSATGSGGLIPKFTYSPTSPTVGAAVFFNAAESTSPIDIVSYDWDFGDGGRASRDRTEHIFAAAGTYVVRLTITDSQGHTATTTQQVTVSVTGSGGLIAKFTFSPTSPKVGATVYFNATESTSPIGIVSYDWDFGDGGRASRDRTEHTFAAAGTYIVRLTITDSQGHTATTTLQVTVTL